MLRQAKTLQTPAKLALQKEQQASRPLDRWPYRFRRRQRGTPPAMLRLLLSILQLDDGADLAAARMQLIDAGDGAVHELPVGHAVH